MPETLDQLLTDLEKTIASDPYVSPDDCLNYIKRLIVVIKHLSRETGPTKAAS
jgi:hypothetical protein